MNQLLIKVFYRSKAIRAWIINPDRRIHCIWVIPKGNEVTFNDHTFILTEDDYLLQKGIPTYIFTTTINRPINPLNIEASERTPKLLNLALNTHVAQDILKGNDERPDRAWMGMLISGLAVVAVIVVAFLGYSYIERILVMLEEIRETLRILGGI